MKKKMLSVAVVLLMGFGVANTVFASEKLQAVTITQEQEEVTYTEIKADELPEAVGVTLKEPAYADYTISKAFLGSDESYKVLLSKENAESIYVFFKATGELIKVEEIEE